MLRVIGLVCGYYHANLLKCFLFFPFQTGVRESQHDALRCAHGQLSLALDRWEVRGSCGEL